MRLRITKTHETAPNECPDQHGHLHNQSPCCMLEEISKKGYAPLPPLLVSTYNEVLEGGLLYPISLKIF